MIQAFKVERDDILMRRLTFGFMLTGDNQPARYLARPTDQDPSHPEWRTDQELNRDPLVVDGIGEGWELVTVSLERGVMAALADAIITETTGTPAADVRLLRKDMEHEQQRRDLLEDAIIEIAKQ